MIPYILTTNSITFVHDGKSHSVPKSHEGFDRIVELVVKEQDADAAIEFLKPVEKVMKMSVEDLVVTEDSITYKGEDLTHTSIGQRIIQFALKEFPTKALENFLVNLFKNPSFRSRKQLYVFLEHKGLPITDDGCFLAYKGVTTELKDCHTRTFDNSVGQIHEMERTRVDDDPNNYCSSGFHAGSLEYARSFGQVVMQVKINPADVVSIPADCNQQKLRTSRYEVISLHENVDQHMDDNFFRTTNEFDEYDGYEDEYDCQHCDSCYHDCDCDPFQEFYHK